MLKPPLLGDTEDSLGSQPFTDSGLLGLGHGAFHLPLPTSSVLTFLKSVKSATCLQFSVQCTGSH